MNVKSVEAMMLQEFKWDHRCIEVKEDSTNNDMSVYTVYYHHPYGDEQPKNIKVYVKIEEI